MTSALYTLLLLLFAWAGRGIDPHTDPVLWALCLVLALLSLTGLLGFLRPARPDHL